MSCSPRLFGVVLTLATCSGCASAVTLRALSSEPPTAPLPERDDGARSVPRIGAPGGSGAGRRSVWPAQSGKEAVGGLLGGKGKSGRRG